MRKYKDKKILILGLGLNQGGVGASKFFANQGGDVLVTDLKDKTVLKSSIDQLRKYKNIKNIKYRLGEHKYKDIDWADIVIRNPALRPDNPFRIYAEKQQKSQTDISIMLDFINPNQIIGITGTKGKSTTANLIYSSLKDVGKKVILAGNIGRSPLDLVGQVTKDFLYILELSSFQLEGFDVRKVSPKYSVITNVYVDHLNYYSSMDDYINSKKIIAKYQTKNDFLFLRHNDPITSNNKFLDNIKSKIIFFSPKDLPKDFKPKLKGEHNLYNIAAALKIGLTFSIDKKILIKSLKNFEGVEYRLQLIKNWNGVKIINDTAASSTAGAVEALKTYPNSILIAGGMDKNLELSEFVKLIKSNAKSVYFLEGDGTEKVVKQLVKQNSKHLIKGTFNNFDDLLEFAKKEVKKGDVILFSPGFTSFNLFQNEWDRGKRFNEAVEKIFV